VTIGSCFFVRTLKRKFLFGRMSLDNYIVMEYNGYAGNRKLYGRIGGNRSMFRLAFFQNTSGFLDILFKISIAIIINLVWFYISKIVRSKLLINKR